jgi:hypothetical protein
MAPRFLRMVRGDAAAAAATTSEESPMDRPRQPLGAPGSRRGPLPRSEAVGVVLAAAPGPDDPDADSRAEVQA